LIFLSNRAETVLEGGGHAAVLAGKAASLRNALKTIAVAHEHV
jgi:hypothetical protein